MATSESKRVVHPATAPKGKAAAVPEKGEAAKSGARAKPKNEALEWVKSIAIAVVLFLFIRTFLIQAYSIPSNSMEDTLLVGDFLMANNTVFGARLPFTDVRFPAVRDPRHGEIVVFRPTYNDPVIDVVKRVVGLPGDTIEMRAHVVHRNGRALEEPYAQLSGTPDRAMERYGPQGYEWHFGALPASVDRRAYAPTRDSWGPLVVPAGHYFVMGDNRDASLDSRYMGFIPRDVIRGKPLFIYFSYDKERFAPFPRFITAARWGRIGDMVR
ncbi:MAG TPA: signal peptidase I [Longimicrobiaceae bacterium]|nr:signal peptidase I [Longimicrobiaceae bacterium]